MSDHARGFAVRPAQLPAPRTSQPPRICPDAVWPEPCCRAKAGLSAYLKAMLLSAACLDLPRTLPDWTAMVSACLSQHTAGQAIPRRRKKGHWQAWSDRGWLPGRADRKEGSPGLGLASVGGSGHVGCQLSQPSSLFCLLQGMFHAQIIVPLFPQDGHRACS